MSGCCDYTYRMWGIRGAMIRYAIVIKMSLILKKAQVTLARPWHHVLDAWFLISMPLLHSSGSPTAHLFMPSRRSAARPIFRSQTPLDQQQTLGCTHRFVTTKQIVLFIVDLAIIVIPLFFCHCITCNNALLPQCCSKPPGEEIETTQGMLL